MVADKVRNQPQTESQHAQRQATHHRVPLSCVISYSILRCCVAQKGCLVLRRGPPRGICSPPSLTWILDGGSDPASGEAHTSPAATNPPNASTRPHSFSFSRTSLGRVSPRSGLGRRRPLRPPSGLPLLINVYVVFSLPGGVEVGATINFNKAPPPQKHPFHNQGHINTAPHLGTFWSTPLTGEDLLRKTATLQMPKPLD